MARARSRVGMIARVVTALAQQQPTQHGDECARGLRHWAPVREARLLRDGREASLEAITRIVICDCLHLNSMCVLASRMNRRGGGGWCNCVCVFFLGGGLFGIVSTIWASLESDGMARLGHTCLAATIRASMSRNGHRAKGAGRVGCMQVMLRRSCLHLHTTPCWSYLWC